jgi:site-specific DNA-methyltransferase (adenine-specific)
VKLYLGDCLDVLRGLPDASVDSVVTDPPYGLSFMGKKWDYDVPSEAIWRECLRVLKPGGHLLAFAGTRTQHRMAVRIEDAGFEIRDMIAWVYGSGFPKSLDVSKAIDKAAGARREVIGVDTARAARLVNQTGKYETDGGWSAGNRSADITAPATEAARQWQGWGTALKPALEPITVARKPLIGTVANNVLEHGTGALNVDGCRVGNEVRYNAPAGNKAGGNSLNMSAVGMPQDAKGSTASGRWPANLIHDGSEEVVELFPQTGPSPKQYEKTKAGWLAPGSLHIKSELQSREYGDSGSAARFFYCAKASCADRNDGCEGMPERMPHPPSGDGRAWDIAGSKSTPRANHHPTVKPTDLMRYLCRLVTPPNGTVLDPFMGSGSTGKAAALEGFDFIGIEREVEYLNIARARIEAAKQG